VKAWGNAPGVGNKFWSAEGAKYISLLQKQLMLKPPTPFRAFSAKKISMFLPGALPQAFTVRAVGAETAVLQTPYLAPGERSQILCGPQIGFPAKY